MIRRRAVGAIIARLLLVGVTARGVSAAEIHVMISGGLTAAYNALAGEFERKTGHRLITVYGASMGTTPTAIPMRLARGEAADVVILARQALDALVESGKVRRGSETDLVRSRIGLAVRAGAAVPDIRTVEGLRQTLLAAESIAYSDSASGVYVSSELFKRLGVEEVAAKARKIPGTPVAEIVARGEAEIGFQQMSELLPVKGVTVVGAIPDDVQRITIYSAGIAAASANAAAGRELIAYLASREAWRAMRDSGVENVGTPFCRRAAGKDQGRCPRGLGQLPGDVRLHDLRLLRGGHRAHLLSQGERIRDSDVVAGNLRRRVPDAPARRGGAGLLR